MKKLEKLKSEHDTMQGYTATALGLAEHLTQAAARVDSVIKGVMLEDDLQIQDLIEASDTVHKIAAKLRKFGYNLSDTAFEKEMLIVHEVVKEEMKHEN